MSSAISDGTTLGSGMRAKIGEYDGLTLFSTILSDWLPHTQ